MGTCADSCRSFTSSSAAARSPSSLPTRTWKAFSRTVPLWRSAFPARAVRLRCGFRNSMSSNVLTPAPPWVALTCASGRSSKWTFFLVVLAAASSGNSAVGSSTLVTAYNPLKPPHSMAPRVVNWSHWSLPPPSRAPSPLPLPLFPLPLSPLFPFPFPFGNQLPHCCLLGPAYGAGSQESQACLLGVAPFPSGQSAW